MSSSSPAEQKDVNMINYAGSPQSSPPVPSTELKFISAGSTSSSPPVSKTVLSKKSKTRIHNPSVSAGLSPAGINAIGRPSAMDEPTMSDGESSGSRPMSVEPESAPPAQAPPAQAPPAQAPPAQAPPAQAPPSNEGQDPCHTCGDHAELVPGTDFISPSGTSIYLECDCFFHTACLKIDTDSNPDQVCPNCGLHEISSFDRANYKAATDIIAGSNIRFPEHVQEVDIELPEPEEPAPVEVWSQSSIERKQKQLIIAYNNIGCDFPTNMKTVIARITNFTFKLRTSPDDISPNRAKQNKLDKQTLDLYTKIAERAKAAITKVEIDEEAFRRSTAEEMGTFLRSSVVRPKKRRRVNRGHHRGEGQ